MQPGIFCVIFVAVGTYVVVGVGDVVNVCVLDVNDVVVNGAVVVAGAVVVNEGVIGGDAKYSYLEGKNNDATIINRQTNMIVFVRRRIS
jgi:hypothetical protein